MATRKKGPRPKGITLKIRKIGINPYVSLPDAVLAAIFDEAGRSLGPIPVRGTLNGEPFLQTLVKYRGAWRLYLNTPMRKAAHAEVGDEVRVVVAFDASLRETPMNASLREALDSNAKASVAFEALVPSRRKEILRYLNALKSPEVRAERVADVVRHLTGQRPRGMLAVLRARR